MSNPIGRPAPAEYPSQADEALCRAQESASDKAAHDAASYVRPGLSPAAVATLDRLVAALGVTV